MKETTKTNINNVTISVYFTAIAALPEYDKSRVYEYANRQTLQTLFCDIHDINMNVFSSLKKAVYNAQTSDEIISVYCKAMPLCLKNSMEAANLLDKFNNVLANISESKTINEASAIWDDNLDVKDIFVLTIDRLFGKFISFANYKNDFFNPKAWIKESIEQAKKNLCADESKQNGTINEATQIQEKVTKEDSKKCEQSQAAYRKEATKATTLPIQPVAPASAAAAVENPDGTIHMNLGKFVNTEDPVASVAYAPVVNQAQSVIQQPMPIQAASTQPIISVPSIPKIKVNSFNNISLANIPIEDRVAELKKHITLIEGTHPGVGNSFVNTLLSLVTNGLLWNKYKRAGNLVGKEGLSFVEIPISTYASEVDPAGYDIALRCKLRTSNGDQLIVYVNTNQNPDGSYLMNSFFPNRKGKKAKNKKNNDSAEQHSEGCSCGHCH